MSSASNSCFPISTDINTEVDFEKKRVSKDVEASSFQEENDEFLKDPLFSYKQHVSQIMSITAPIIMSEIFQNTLPVIDLGFVGNLPDKNDLAAAALATVWFNLWNATMLGFMTAIDTMLAQSFGAKELKSFSKWTGSSIVIVSIVSVFISGIVALCQPAMVAFGQDKDIAAAAGDFTAIQRKFMDAICPVSRSGA